MKICFVITNAPPLVGGLEKVCLRLAQNLQRLGHEVRILGRFTQGRHRMEDFFSFSEKVQELKCDGVAVRVLGLDAKARLLLKLVFKLIWRKSTFPLARWLYVAAMRGQIAGFCRGADVVHFFGNGPEMLGFAAEAAAREVEAQFVVEPALHEGQWGDKWFDALLYKRADCLLAHTRHEAGVLERMGSPATKIRTIVHGVDFCDSGDGERFRGKHEIAGPMVLFLGRKTREKGLGRLLEAWPMVAEKFPAATLVIAGPKSALGALEDIRWKIEDRDAAEPPVANPAGIKIQDATGQDGGGLMADSAGGAKALDTSPKALNLDDLAEVEKQDVLAACDLLCVPSEGESFGMVYFEAWAYKKPVVALDLPVLRETIGAAKAGILVKNDPREVANGLLRLLGNSDLRNEMGECGMELSKKHSWDESLKSYESAYRFSP